MEEEKTPLSGTRTTQLLLIGQIILEEASPVRLTTVYIEKMIKTVLL